MEDNDEDFIAKGTPLHDYLVQIGVLDSVEEHPIKKKKKSQSSLEIFLDSILDKLQVWFQPPDSSLPSNDLRVQAGRELFPMFSRLLLRDDYVLLHHLQQDSASCSTISSWQIPVVSIVLVALMGVAVVSSWATISLMALVLGLIALWSGWLPHLYLRIYGRPSLFASCAQLASHLHSLLTLLHRSLSYLREAEVLEFGYTLHSLCIQSWRAGTPALNKTSDYSELKKRLALLLHEIFFIFQRATSELRSLVPLEEYDLDSFYLRHVPLTEFNLHLELDLTDPQQKSQFCNFFATGYASNLKTLFDLVLAQVSEFLRRLCLSFLASPTISVVKVFLHCHRHIHGLLPQVSDLLSASQGFLQVHCTRHSASLPPEPLRAPRGTLDSPLSTALHNLQLNLHVLLSIVSQLAEAADGEEIATEDLQAKMAQVSDIFEHTPGLVSQSARLIPRKEKGGGPLEDSLVPPPPPPPTYHVPDADPVIYDQVFIGRADPQDKTPTDFSSSDEFFMPGKQKLIYKDVFKELKMAIAVKAEEHKRREAQALGGLEEDPTEETANGDDLLEEDKLAFKEDKFAFKEDKPASKEDSMEEDIPKFQPPNLPSNFSSLISAMAQQHSQRLGLSEETFSDGSDDDLVLE